MKKIITLLMLCCAFNLSCDKSYLEVDSVTENSENYFNTSSQYETALVATYAMLYSTYLNVMVGEIASDNTLAGGESAKDVVGIQEIDDMIQTPVNAQLRNIWQWMYAGIYRANYIMEFQNKIDFKGKDQVLAETRFLRAYFYFELVKWFGGVPLSIDKRFQFGDQDAVDRATKEAVYAEIEKDLLYAISILPTVQADKGRATKGAAQALLGKAYLYQDKFDLAAEMFENVINSGTYRLVSNYATIFEPQGENNTESVFEIQYTDNTAGAGASFDCLQCSPGNIAVGFNGVRSFKDASNTFDGGYGFNVPTQELYDAFEIGDVRRDVTILNIEEHINQYPGSTFAKGFEHTGYYNRKYLARKGDLNLGDENLTNPNNYRAIRYADVLLMAAESLNRGRIDDAKALTYLNQVRNRAKLSSLNVSATELTEAIYKERRVELAGEGHRFFDLVRTGKAAENMTKEANQGAFIKGKHEIFPIPSIEIELAGNRWQQNPNY